MIIQKGKVFKNKEILKAKQRGCQGRVFGRISLFNSFDFSKTISELLTS